MPQCCVFGCNTNAGKDKDLSFHRFPNREKSPKRFKLWEIKIGRKSFKPSKISVVCSKHFTTDDFETSVKQRVMKDSKVKAILKKTAVPTLYLKGVSIGLSQPKRGTYVRKRLASTSKDDISKSTMVIGESGSHSTETETSTESEIGVEVLRNIEDTSEGHPSDLETSFLIEEEELGEEMEGSDSNNDERGLVMESDSQQVDIKIEIKEEPVCLDETVFVNVGADYSEVKLKEEPGWLSAQEDVKDTLTSVDGIAENNALKESPRSYPEELPSDGSNISSLCTVAALEIEGCEKQDTIACNICGKCFELKTQLEKHKLVHEDKRPYSCKLCGKHFKQLSYLRAHTLVHEGKKPHKCGICECSFQRSSNLHRHLRRHEGKLPFKCKVCQKSFSQKSHLKRHSAVHDKECEFCERPFRCLLDLNQTDTVHDGKHSYMCDICGKTFQHMTDVKAHSFIHESERQRRREMCTKCSSPQKEVNVNRPHKCELCEKSFAHIWSYKSHMRGHEGKRPYKCQVCGKSYKQMSHLTQHKIIHEDIRPFKCEICGKGFKQASHLKSHCLIHENEKLFKCDICEKTFQRRSNMRKHLKIHEGIRPFKCQVCDKSFFQSCDLKRHCMKHEK